MVTELYNNKYTCWCTKYLYNINDLQRWVRCFGNHRNEHQEQQNNLRAMQHRIHNDKKHFAAKQRARRQRGNTLNHKFTPIQGQDY